MYYDKYQQWLRVLYLMSNAPKNISRKKEDIFQRLDYGIRGLLVEVISKSRIRGQIIKVAKLKLKSLK